MGTSPLSGKSAVFLDLDGVVYAGDTPLPGAVETVNRLHREGYAIRFLTNNASVDPKHTARKLARMGIRTDESWVMSSAEVAVDVLTNLILPQALVLVVGSAYLARLVEEQGFTLTQSADNKPSAVIQGLHPGVSWSLLAEATAAISQGAIWVATNTDRTLPTDRGIMPGNGLLVDVIRKCLQQDPKVIAGKPAPLMFHAALRSCRVDAAQALMLGDRLDTDIRGAQNAGLTAACVLSGVTQAEDIAASRSKPDFVLESLEDLFS